jgi:hypothetical protein
MVALQRIEEELVKVSTEITLQELYSQIPGYELLIEPLSQRKKIKDFIEEGGLGYYSLKEGSFSSCFYRVKSKTPEGEFEYGLGKMALYNVGYPLFRLNEMKAASFFKKDLLGEIKEITIPLREKQLQTIVFQKKDLTEVTIPPEATNVGWINQNLAQIIGREEGMFVSYPSEMRKDDSKEEDFWEKRFVEDLIYLEEKPAFLKMLVMRSALPEIYQLVAERKGLFFALFVHLGVLVLISGSQEMKEEIKNKMGSFSYRWILKEK